MVVLNCGDNYFVTGGSDSYMFGLTELLEGNNHKVIPFAPKNENNFATKWDKYFPDCFEKKKASISKSYKYFYNKDAKVKLFNLLDDVHIDVAHLHIYYGSLTGAIFEPFQKRGIPVVQSLHEYKLACPVYTMVSNGTVCEACEGHKFWKAIPRKCKQGAYLRTMFSVAEAYTTRWLGSIDKVDHFIAVSDFMRKKMLQYNIGEGKISTIHNFVDPDFFEPSGVTGEYFLYFGRLERLKGLFTLIEASSRIPEIPLIIVGTGDAYFELNNTIQEKRLNHISLVGFKSGDELEKLIKGSICTVVPSEWYENCPMSVLESLAYAKPVIGANIGGIPELIVNEQDGFLFEAGSVDELEEKLRWLGFNTAKAKEMGDKGRKKIEKRFSKEVHYQKIMDVYKNLIN